MFRGVTIAAIAVAGALGLSNSTLAADWSVTSPTPIYNWGGLYFGGNVGGGFGSYDYVFSGPTRNVGSSLSGAIGGAQIGYNWQAGSIVLGAEADIQASGISGTSLCPNTAFSCNASVPWLATVRGRIGLPVNQFMPYITGGLAIGGMNRSSTNTANGDSISQSATHVGWTAGGGIDWMLNNNWIVGVEGLYVSLGSKTYAATTAGTSTFSAVSIGSGFAVARLKASYRLP